MNSSSEASPLDEAYQSSFDDDSDDTDSDEDFDTYFQRRGLERPIKAGSIAQDPAPHWRESKLTYSHDTCNNPEDVLQYKAVVATDVPGLLKRTVLSAGREALNAFANLRSARSFFFYDPSSHFIIKRETREVVIGYIRNTNTHGRPAIGPLNLQNQNIDLEWAPYAHYTVSKAGVWNLDVYYDKGVSRGVHSHVSRQHGTMRCVLGCTEAAQRYAVYFHVMQDLSRKLRRNERSKKVVVEWS